MPAGKLGFSPICGDEFHERTLLAGLSLFFASVIDAGWRIFEHEVGSPRITGLPPVPAVFQERQLRSQDLLESLAVLHV
jgi:hypothetical protein